MFTSGVMIVCFNAASQNRSILSLLPEYAMRHHTFFRDKYPHLFPELAAASTQVGQDEILSSVIGSTPLDQPALFSLPQSDDPATFFDKAIRKFDDINNFISQHKYDHAARLIQSCARQVL